MPRKAYLEALRCPEQEVNPLFCFLGARLVAAGEGKACIELPVTGKLAQGGGVVAGGILATIADEAMAHAVLSILDADKQTVTTEMNIRYLRATDPHKKGTLVATARVVKPGRSIMTADAEIHDAAGRLLATAGGSFFVVDNPVAGKR